MIFTSQSFPGKIFGRVQRLRRLGLGLAAGLLAAGAFGQSDYATPYAFAVLAGSPPGTVGNWDGTGSSARFDNPNGTAVDGAGNVYVADTEDNLIRKITPDGVVTTLAGTPGQAGTADGTGIEAQFSAPFGITIDRTGNLYVVDLGSTVIRKVTPTVVDGVTLWVVTTIAGSTNHSGAADGTGTAAQFDEPKGIAVDGDGNLYVADSFNDTIRKITPTVVDGATTWAVTTLAGAAGQSGGVNGTGSGARFNFPAGVAVDGAGNVYVADTLNLTIRRITPAGVVNTLAGAVGIFGPADGIGVNALFSSPTGIAVDGGGNLYVTDAGSTIRKITPTSVNGVMVWVVTTLAGSPAEFGSNDGTGAAARFDMPSGLAVDGSDNLYVADTLNDTIRKMTSADAVTTLAGSARQLANSNGFGSADGIGDAAKFGNPNDVSVDSAGNVYVADSSNDTIRKVTPDAVVTTLAGTAGIQGSADGTGGAAQFSFPTGMAVDGAGNVYVADTGNNTIRKVTPGGMVTTLAGAVSPGFGIGGSADGTGSAAQFYTPSGLAMDGAGNLYVADTHNSTIRKVTPTTVNGVTAWVVTTVAGATENVGGANGIGAAAQFSSPVGLALDGAGNIYVADTQNNAIRKITPTPADGVTAWVVTTLAGTASPFSAGSADGAGAAAQFKQPSGVAVDGAGNVYVADTGNDTIRRITPAGVVTTLAGAAGDAGFGPVDSVYGTGSAALFRGPVGIAVDGAGNLYVADTTNFCVRIGSLAGPPIRTQPESQTLNAGSTAVLTGVASGASSYQWEFNGNPIGDSPGGAGTDVISGATGPQLVITHATSASDGTYTLVATNAEGSSTSSAAVLEVTGASDPGLAAGISTRAFVGTGDNILIGGFYIVGSTSRTVLVQGLGPALSPLGVSDALQHPALSIHQSQNGGDVTLYSNTGWSTNTGAAEQQVLLAAAASVFASPTLTQGSADSELLLTLPPGGYSAEVSGADGGTGVALCAIYELP